MSAEELNEMGPVDYLVVEWSGKQPTGDAAPLLIDLVDRGLIRVLDLAFIAKGEDGSVAALEISDLAESDIDDAGTALEPGTSAAVLVYENRWAAPFAAALRDSGAELVASGRIPIQNIVAALDAVDAQS